MTPEKKNPKDPEGMTPIAERLRDWATWYPAEPPREPDPNNLLYEAADELYRLAARVEVLTEALTIVPCGCLLDESGAVFPCYRCAALNDGAL